MYRARVLGSRSCGELRLPTPPWPHSLPSLPLGSLAHLATCLGAGTGEPIAPASLSLGLSWGHAPQSSH